MRNDFIQEMTTTKPCRKWINRIKDIKNWMIDDTVNAARPHGISREEAAACKAFLKFRRDNIDLMFLDNKEHFPNITEWTIPGRLA